MIVIYCNCISCYFIFYFYFYLTSSINTDLSISHPSSISIQDILNVSTAERIEEGTSGPTCCCCGRLFHPSLPSTCKEELSFGVCAHFRLCWSMQLCYWRNLLKKSDTPLVFYEIPTTLLSLNLSWVNLISGNASCSTDAMVEPG